MSGREVCHDGRDKEMGGTLKEREKTAWNERDEGEKKEAGREKKMKDRDE